MNTITYVFEKCPPYLFVQIINIMHTKTQYYCAFIASNLIVLATVMFVSQGYNVRFLGYLEKKILTYMLKFQYTLPCGSDSMANLRFKVLLFQYALPCGSDSKNGVRFIGA